MSDIGAEPEQLRQPFLHELVTSVAAPTQVLSDRTGDIVASRPGPGAQGIIHADVRVVSDLRVTVEGTTAEHIATGTDGTETVFTGLLRRLPLTGSGSSDPQLRLDRYRQVMPGAVVEELVLTSLLPEPAPVAVAVTVRSDFASVDRIKIGIGSQPVALPEPVPGGELTWGSAGVSVTLSAPGADWTRTDPEQLTLRWSVVVPARGTATVGWNLSVADPTGAVVAARSPGLPVAQIVAAAVSAVQEAGVVEPRLAPWLARSLTDLDGLRMATADDPADSFFAAGAPWFLTLFGRDSLWTSRLLLPVDVHQAAGTLRTLARLAGTRSDPDTAESPGKIMHELRRGQVAFRSSSSLPPLYYGTIDATPLWVCLLHDAWRAGLDPEVVQELLPTLQAALGWLVEYGDADGDGFLEYLDASGRGLANQGWKDSGDSIRFADGTIATGPVALCEVQGYAHEAAVSGATLLDAFGLPGGDGYRSWAADLRRRFRESFWCGEGEDRCPALALDGRKVRVDSVTSNIGHLLGTGILSDEEERLVARRVTADDLDSGLGLRTMSSTAGGYSPLSYHCGSVWPHDTAIVVNGLLRAGLVGSARGLIEGLLRASVAFEQRFPELWSGEGRAVPYPAACRPQAWSAAAAVTVAEALRQPVASAG